MGISIRKVVPAILLFTILACHFSWAGTDIDLKFKRIQELADNPAKMDSLLILGKKGLELEQVCLPCAEDGIRIAKVLQDSISLAHFQALLALSYLTIGEMDSANQWHGAAMDMIQSTQNHGEMVQILINWGVAQTRMGNFPASLRAMRQALTYSKRHGISESRSKIHRFLALAYQNLSDYPAAIQQNIAVLERSRHQPADRIMAHLNLANCYDLKGEKQQAELEFARAWEVLHAAGDSIPLPKKKNLEAALYNDEGVFLRESGAYSRAKTNYEKARALYQESGQEYSAFIAQVNIGYTQLFLGDYAGADENFNALEAMAEEKGMQGLSLHIALMRAEGLVMQGRHKTAEKAYQEVLENYASLLPANMRMELHRQRADNLEQAGRYQEAFSHQKSYFALRDSLFDQEKLQEAARYQVEFEIGQEILADSLAWEQRLDQEQLKQLEEKNALQAIIFWLVTGLLVLASLTIIFILVQRNRRKMRQKELQRVQESREHLERELAMRHKELSTTTLQLLNKNQLLDNLHDQVAALQKSTATAPQHGAKQQLLEMQQLIRSDARTSKDWEHFKFAFEGVHPGFLGTLKRNNPNLTAHELRILSMLKVNLNTQQIASILGISPDSVKKARYRIRKKIELPQGQKLIDFVLAFKAI